MAFWRGAGMHEDEWRVPEHKSTDSCLLSGERVLYNSFTVLHVPTRRGLHGPGSWPGVGAFTVVWPAKPASLTWSLELCSQSPSGQSCQEAHKLFRGWSWNV